MISASASKDFIRCATRGKKWSNFSATVTRRTRRICCTHAQGAGACSEGFEAKGRYLNGRRTLASQRHHTRQRSFFHLDSVVVDDYRTSYPTILAAAIAVAIATWGTTTVSSSEGAFYNKIDGYTNNQTSSSNADMMMEQAKNQLGIALAKLHERQKVTLGRLLYDFHQLAEEAKERGSPSSGGYESTAYEDIESKTRQAESNFIQIPGNSLSDLTPQAAWYIIKKLQKGEILCQDDLKRVIHKAIELLQKEQTVIDLRGRSDLRTITVVGDIHGDMNSLFDILGIFGEHVFDSCNEAKEASRDIGSPWNGTGAIVFNGDFVDRGENSIGVILTLLLLKIIYPQNIYLNRGNHEDPILSEVYGFSEELQERYGVNDVDDVWEAMGQLFSTLPLCVRTDTAAIMHGGIPSDRFKLSELEDITPEQRSRIKSVMDSGDDVLCELVRNVLWSDPMIEDGVQPNDDRGAGICFGPDIIERFLADHGLKYLIRSHEVKVEGFDQMECSEENSAITVFSSVNYPNGKGFNLGAVIHLSSDGSFAPVSFHRQLPGSCISQDEYFDRIIDDLVELIAENKLSLLSAFEQKSGGGKFVTGKQWAEVMYHELRPLGLGTEGWLSLQPYLAPDVMEGLEVEGPVMIDYNKFLALHCDILTNSIDDLDDEALETLRRYHAIIITVFKFLDTNGNGLIDLDEFRAGVKLLSKRFPHERKFDDPDALFNSIDIDRNGMIDLDEFEKVFKAVEMSYSDAVFKLFDKDRNGTLDREEFREALIFLNCRLSQGKKIAIDKSNILFDKLDIDKSGVLELDEVKHFLSDIVAEQI